MRLDIEMYRKVFITIVILSIAISCNARKNRVRRIVGGEPAEAPPVDDPVVFTRFGGKTARVQGVLDAPHYVFRGIRYAHAPVGKERFLVRFLEINLTSEKNLKNYSFFNRKLFIQF